MLVTARVWQRGGGDPNAAMWVCLLAAPAAVLGGRVYAVAADSLRHATPTAFNLTHGGMAYYGVLAGGFAAIVVQARARSWPVGTFLDCAAVGLGLGQAIGRFGDWFAQASIGTPTSVPWALRVDPAFRPVGLADQATYHPAFLYEAAWDLIVVVLLMWLWPVLTTRFRPGCVAASYVALYSAGRIVVEAVRSDPSAIVAGLRINQLVGMFAIASALLLLASLDRRRPPSRRR
jgi:prolipoprotein diacylglyceryl transferase